MLALLVMMQHFQHLLPLAQRSFFSRMGLGAIAVAVFFAISGFVVAEANATFYAGRPGAFLLNRLLRLAPPYYAALALSVAVHAALAAGGRLAAWGDTLHGDPLAAARLASGVLGLVPGASPRWFGQDFEFIPFVWSLRLEMAFYLAAAAAFATAARLRRRWIIPLSFSAALLASALFLLADRPGALSAAPMFLAGAALYGQMTGRSTRRATALGTATLVAIGGFASWHQHGAPILAWQLSALAGLAIIFVCLARSTARYDVARIDRALGGLSYPLYLNHYAVGLLAGGLSPRLGIGLYAGALAASVALAACAERLVETPLRLARARIRQAPLE